MFAEQNPPVQPLFIPKKMEMQQRIFYLKKVGTSMLSSLVFRDGSVLYVKVCVCVWKWGEGRQRRKEEQGEKKENRGGERRRAGEGKRGEGIEPEDNTDYDS